MAHKFFALLAVLVLLGACAPAKPSGADIRVENAWARPTAALDARQTSDTPHTPAMDMPGMAQGGLNSAVYFVITNAGDQADTLTGVSASIAAKASIHETQVKGDVAQMTPVESLQIPAHGKVEFQPGGYHVMLEELRQELVEGSTFTITLQFEKSGAITLENVPVRPQ